MLQFKIVGQYFRKENGKIQDILPVNFQLYIQREPSNEHDPNAIGVYAKWSEVQKLLDENEEAAARLRQKVEGFGVDWDAEFTTYEWHQIAYIARDLAPPSLHEKLADDEYHPCIFVIGVDGKAAIQVY
jgi:hypothetical protein